MNTFLKSIYSSIDKYNCPVFVVPPLTTDGKTYDKIIPVSCSFKNDFYNITLNNNCFQFLRRVKVNGKNPYFSKNAPTYEYHLVSIYLQPGKYETIDSVVDSINRQIFNTCYLLFEKNATEKNIIKGINYNIGTSSNLDACLYVEKSNFTISTTTTSSSGPIDSNISQTDLTIAQVNDEKQYLKWFAESLSYYNYINRNTGTSVVNYILKYSTSEILNFTSSSTSATLQQLLNINTDNKVVFRLYDDYTVYYLDTTTNTNVTTTGAEDLLVGQFGYASYVIDTFDPSILTQIELFSTPTFNLYFTQNNKTLSINNNLNQSFGIRKFKLMVDVYDSDNILYLTTEINYDTLAMCYDAMTSKLSNDCSPYVSIMNDDFISNISTYGEICRMRCENGPVPPSLTPVNNINEKYTTTPLRHERSYKIYLDNNGIKPENEDNNTGTFQYFNDYETYNNSQLQTDVNNQKQLYTYFQLVNEDFKHPHLRFVSTEQQTTAYIDTDGVPHDSTNADDLINVDFSDTTILTQIYIRGTNSSAFTTDAKGEYNNTTSVTFDSPSLIYVRFKKDTLMNNDWTVQANSLWEATTTAKANSEKTYYSSYTLGSTSSQHFIVENITDFTPTTLTDDVTIPTNYNLLNDVFYKTLFNMSHEVDMLPFYVKLDDDDNIVCNINDLQIVPVYQSLSEPLKINTSIKQNNNTFIVSRDLYLYNQNTNEIVTNRNFTNIANYKKLDNSINQILLKSRKNKNGLFERCGYLCYYINNNAPFKYIKTPYYTDEIFNGTITIGDKVVDYKSLPLYDGLLFNNEIKKVSELTLLIPSTLNFKITTSSDVDNIVNNTENKNDGFYTFKNTNEIKTQTIDFMTNDSYTIPPNGNLYVYVSNDEQPYALINGSFKLEVMYL